MPTASKRGLAGIFTTAAGGSEPNAATSASRSCSTRANSREARYCSAFSRPRTRIALVHLRKAREPVEHPHDSVGRVDLQVVDVALEPVRWREGLGEQQVAGGEVHADLRPKPAARLARHVDPTSYSRSSSRSASPLTPWITCSRSWWCLAGVSIASRWAWSARSSSHAARDAAGERRRRARR